MNPPDKSFAHRCLNSLSRNLQVACCSAPIGRHRTETDLDFPQINCFFSLVLSDWSIHAFILGTCRLASVYIRSFLRLPFVPAVLPRRSILTCTRRARRCQLEEIKAWVPFAAVLNTRISSWRRDHVSRWLDHFHLRDSSHANRDSLKLHDYVARVSLI